MASSGSSKQQQHNFHGAGLEYQEEFQKWWSIARQSEEPPSPHDFLINFGLAPQVVQQFLGEVLHKCCVFYHHDINNNNANDGGFGRHYGQPLRGARGDHASRGPGSIDYIAWHCWVRVGNKYYSNGDNDLAKHVVQETPRQSHSEQDILTLVDSIEPNGRYQSRYGTIPVYECLARNYNLEFVRTLIQKYPLDNWFVPDLQFDDHDLQFIGCPGHRKVLDSDCIAAISDLLPKLERCRLAGIWKMGAFVDCLDKLLNCCTNLQRLEVAIPNCPLEEDQGYDHHPITFPSKKKKEARDKDTTWKVPYLVIRTNSNNDSTPEPWLGGIQLALECMPQMELLQKLEIECYDLPLPTAAPYIIQELTKQDTMLRQLSIVAARPTTVTATAALPTTTQSEALLEVLEALRHNTSLTHLRYQEDIKSPPSSSQNFQSTLYESKLLEVLQESNTDLVFARFSKYNPYHPPSLLTPWKSEIDYYLSLNHNGRKLARDPETNLLEFVDLLVVGSGGGPNGNALDVSVSWGEDDDDDSPSFFPVVLRDDDSDCLDLSNDDELPDLGELNILFGLLREMPTKWTSCCPTPPPLPHALIVASPQPHNSQITGAEGPTASTTTIGPTRKRKRCSE